MSAARSMIKRSAYSPSSHLNNAFLVIDLPPGSILSLDGNPIVPKINDFLGFGALPQDEGFHLVTIRAAAISTWPDKMGEVGNPSAINVGFLLFTSKLSISIRQFNPKTEEVSALPVDALTAENLISQIRRNQIRPDQIVSYEHAIPSNRIQAWETLTNYITESFIRYKGFVPGEKVIPGVFDEDLDDGETDDTQPALSTPTVDGQSIRYPSIPVLILSDAARFTQHKGTKSFCAGLSSSERTNLFTSKDPALGALDHILQSRYHGRINDLLGDIQFSFVLFLHIHCYAAFCHWRDLLAMVSAVKAVYAAQEYCPLYEKLLVVVLSQLCRMDADLCDEMEFAGDGFFRETLYRLASIFARVFNQRSSNQLDVFCQHLAHMFPKNTGSPPDTEESNHNDIGSDSNSFIESGESDNDDPDDGPMIVTFDDVNASLMRSEHLPTKMQYPEEICKSYPLLIAAMSPDEDIVMTCARALDCASDVSLVREAAAYLQTRESRKHDAQEGDTNCWRALRTGIHPSVQTRSKNPSLEKKTISLLENREK